MLAAMDVQLWGLVAAILFPLGMMALRVLTRDRHDHHEVEGVAVYEGSRGGCRDRVDVLADAGVTAWIEATADGHAVHVDAAQAADIPELLQRRGQDPVPESG